MKNYLYISPSMDGHVNLANDEYFLDTVAPDAFLLHFYVNENAVIIGANQNPWAECNLKRMKEDGVQLVRRITGGGAVFHDRGNLNFSFIAGAERYDLTRQLGLILTAVRALGIPCEFTGRNDLTADGRKFSGNAFITRNGIKQHHGTLLINADLSRLGNYLNVDPRKLQSKGTRSVRSRVCNLSDFDPALSTGAMLQKLCAAYAREYGEYEQIETLDTGLVQPYLEKQRSDAWRLGKTHPFDIEIENRFSWGNLQLMLCVEKGVITQVQAYSDANDVTIASQAGMLLQGCAFSSAAMEVVLRSGEKSELDEMADYIETLVL